jgi:hypothetical protein
VFQRFLHHVGEVAAFGAVTVMVLAGISLAAHGPAEEISGLLDLTADARQVSQFHRGPIFLDQVNQGDVVERKVSVFQVETVLGKVESLINEVKVLVSQLRGDFKTRRYFLSATVEKGKKMLSRRWLERTVCR